MDDLRPLNHPDVRAVLPQSCGVGRSRTWIALGLRMPGGTRERLPAVRVGGRWMVAPADVAAFVARMTAAYQNRSIAV